MSNFNGFLKVSVIAIWLGVVFLSARFVENWRISKQYADLLPASAQQVLAAQSTLQIDVFALPDSAAAQLVDNFLQPLVNLMKTVEVNYIGINQNPELAKQHNIQKQGEMVVHSGDQYFQLSTLSYETFFNGLKRLDQPNDGWIVFLENLSSHSFGAPKSLVQNNSPYNSYSAWLNQLMSANYQTIVLPWQPQMTLPKQARLLVLAAPSISLTEPQLLWLEGQIEQGLAVLWLTDPKYATAQPALSLLFDVMRTDAFHQGQLVLKEYPEHLINQNFDRPLDLFEVMPFETANQPLWVNEQGQTLAATQQIDSNKEISTTSRMMVIGDSQFLTDQYLNSGGNLEMSYRLLDWLLWHDHRIDLPSIGVADTQLHFSAREILWLAGIMLIIIPLIFLILAGYFWRKTK